MKVKDIMTPNPIVLKLDYSLYKAARILREHNIEGAPVVDRYGKLIGLCTKTDLLAFLGEKEGNSLTLNDIHFGPVNIVAEDSDIRDLVQNGSGLSVVVDEKKKPVAVISSSDLLKGVWQRAQEESRELSTIFEASQSGFLVVSKAGFITRANKVVSEMLGTGERRLIGEKITDFIPGLSISDVLASKEKVLAEKMDCGDKTYLIDKIPIKSEGAISGILLVLRDIADFKSIVNDLESVQRFSDKVSSVIKSSQAILESTTDGLFITDGRGVVIRINQSYEDMTGILEGELMNRSVYDLAQEGFFKPSATLEVLKTRKTTILRQKMRNGKDFLVTANPIFDEDKNLIMVVENVRDVSELMNLENQIKEMKELTRKYYNELEEMRIQMLDSGDIIAKDRKMVDILQVAKRVSQVDTTIMLLGETGVGKEEVAKFIHKESRRAKTGQFIKINCGAIPHNLIESELFGYEKGAFTGANREGKLGLFEVAEGGTLFLDEIAELPLEMQVKLLRALQEKEIKRVGGVKPIKIDVRILAATNQNLEELVRENRFREDLYYRLNVIPIYIPPLRQRKEDIFALAFHFLNKFNEEYQWNKSFSPEILNCFYNYNWPGNVRELKNVIERIIVMSDSDKVTIENLPDQLRMHSKMAEIRKFGNGYFTLKEAVSELEKEMIIESLKREGSLRKAAAALGIDHATMIRKKRKYGII